MSALIEHATLALKRSDALLITAGAGMGVDSGLPDFRGPQGFWKAYPPYRHLGLGFAQLANPRWFAEDPPLAWGFYGHRLGLYRRTTPHAGFAILRQWAQRMAGGHFVITSNVDGHFQKAGFDEACIAEVHGSILHLQCASDCEGIWPATAVTVEVDPATFRARGSLPTCPQCGGLARPNILMFGDDGWRSQRSHRQEHALSQWLDRLTGRRLVIVECGAGTALPTIRRYGEHLAAKYAATLVRINLRESDVTPGHVGLTMGCAEALAAIERQWSKELPSG